MIDIVKAKIAFKDFLDEYQYKSDLGFEYKDKEKKAEWKI